MTEPAERLRPGRVVAGRFEVVRMLGEGGMGVVYEALQRALDRPVALKVLRPAVAASPGARARFEREARVAAALRHPSAVEIHDFGEDEGLLYLAMERLSGATLGASLALHGPLGAVRLVELGAQVASVLVEAHAIGLVHRDLKPGNIFVEDGTDGRRRAVVADFGLAFIRDREGVGRLTLEGLLTGTPAYVSPEQALGREVGPESDLYSLGCTLYEVAAGRPPFQDRSELALVNMHLFACPEPLRRARPDSDLPHALDVLVLAMLAKRPEDRPSALEVLAGLEGIRAGLGLRERGRGEEPWLERALRTLPERPAAASAPTLAAAPPSGTAATAPAGCRLAVVGPGLDEGLRRALAAAGVTALGWPEGRPPAGAEAIYAPGASADRLGELAAHGLPLVTDVEPTDLAQLARLLRAGLDEAVPRPVRPEELARRVLRAVRRARRRA